MAVETLAQRERQQSQYIDFWNSVLVPKFIRWKHILVDGLTSHSEAIFPTLPVKSGDKVVDAGICVAGSDVRMFRERVESRGFRTRANSELGSPGVLC